eukprot:2681078-Rhodomonas_salina.3
MGVQNRGFGKGGLGTSEGGGKGGAVLGSLVRQLRDPAPSIRALSASMRVPLCASSVPHIAYMRVAPYASSVIVRA